MNCCLQNILRTTHQFTYYIYFFFSRQFQKCKNDENPTNTSKVTSKTIFIILFKMFSIGDSFEFKATRETRLI